jgi:integrase
MTVRKERHVCPKTGKERWYWRVDVVFEHPDGRRQRVRKRSPIQTKRGAEHYERQLRQSLVEGTYKRRKEEKSRDLHEIPKVESFAQEFIEVYAKTNNKPSEVQSKESILVNHLLPEFGKLSLDEVDVRSIERFKSRQLKKGLSPKSVNNQLTVLRRMLSVGQEWGVLDAVPPVKWLRVARPDFEFLDFDEAERLLKGADEEWRPMILLGLRAGLRLGELRAIRWGDVDLVAGRLVVRRAVARGTIGTPKSGKTREIPLSRRVVRELKAARHLKGELIFCQADGAMLTRNSCKWPLWRACRRAGIRKIGWHVLRHTFASHMVMRGKPIKVVQELLGHATIEMTMRYSHLTPDVRRDAVESLDLPAENLRPHHGHIPNRFDRAKRK